MCTRLVRADFAKRFVIFNFRVSFLSNTQYVTCQQNRGVVFDFII